MAEHRSQRRLAAILAADVVGYSRLMHKDETGTLARLKALRADLLDRRIAEHGGRVVKLMGDGQLVEFGSVVDAVECAVAIQKGVTEHDVELDEAQRIRLRIGVNVGDVIVEDDDVYGDGVNIADRLQVLADPGGICLSRSAFDQVKGKVACDFDDLGDQALKNIEEPVRVYRITSAMPADARQAPAAAGTSVFKIPARPSLAILPFVNLSSGSEHAHLADGIRLGIQSALVHVSGVSLLNPSSVEPYRDRNVPATAVGRELNVRYVLEGAVQAASQRARATLQLTDVDNGEIVWGERYDRILDDIFELQDEVIREVFDSLNIELLPAEASLATLQLLKQPEARDLYYRAIAHAYRATRSDNAAARKHFEAIQRLEPDSGIAASFIAMSHWVDGVSGWSDSAVESMQKAESWAETAIRASDSNGFGHVVLGNLRLLDGRHDEGLAYCQRAGTLRANCPLTHGQLANALNYCGDAAAAVKSARYALNLTRAYPVWLINILAAAYRDTGEVDLCIAAATEAARLDPRQAAARVILCTGYALAGRGAQAKQVAQEILAIEPSFRLADYARSQPYRDTAVLDRLLQLLLQAGLPA